LRQVGLVGRFRRQAPLRGRLFRGQRLQNRERGFRQPMLSRAWSR
jgi:hypothetical protein